MKKDVILRITGFSTNDAGQTDTNETVTKASYYKKNGAHHILYEDEMSAESARYKLNHRAMEVIKNGDLAAKMFFEAGRTFTSIYRTPYGRMPLTFVTKQYAFYEEAGELRVEASYTILNDDVFLSENRIVVRISEQ